MSVSGWIPAVWRGGPVSGLWPYSEQASLLNYQRQHLRGHNTGPGHEQDHTYTSDPASDYLRSTFVFFTVLNY